MPIMELQELIKPMEKEKWYEIAEVDKVDSPALLIFPERVKANIQTAINMVGNVNRLRPHVKTHKSPDTSKLMIEAGITKFKCATIAEAEMLAQCGAKDVLLAYQPWGPKLQRFIQLIKKYPQTSFSCLTDNIDAAKEQDSEFQKNKLSVPVYIDLNIGMNRTGITADDRAFELYKFCSTLKGINVIGLHAYDGHLRDSDYNLRKQKCDEAFSLVEKLKDKIVATGLPTPKIIAGGSPGFSIHCNRDGVECSPGTFIYWDKGYLDLCPEQSFLPAAVLLTRVISLPSANRICTDLGHKSVAPENEITRRIFFLNASGLTPVGQSEEHLVLEINDGKSYKVGDIFYGLPIHVCPTIALYERAITIEKGKVTGTWKNTARDRTITI